MAIITRPEQDTAQKFLAEILKELCVELPEDCGTQFRLLALIQRRDLRIQHRALDYT